MAPHRPGGRPRPHRPGGRPDVCQNRYVANSGDSRHALWAGKTIEMGFLKFS